MKEINAELLLGRKVKDSNGEAIGRIEEIRCDRQDNVCLVEGYLVGTSGLLQRLNAWSLVRPISHLFKGSRFYTLYDIPWNELDLTDPENPRSKASRAELKLAR